MSKLITVSGTDRLQFECPGCECSHFVNSTWQFNGDFDNPTIRPSILVNSNLACPDLPQCHLFITNGNIEFLGDCSHGLAGKTVEMSDV